MVKDLLKKKVRQTSKIPNFKFAQEFRDGGKEKSIPLTALEFQVHVFASHGTPERINF